MSAVGHTPDSDPWQVSPCRSDAGAQRRFFALEAFWTPGLQVSTPDPSLGILFFLVSRGNRVFLYQFVSVRAGESVDRSERRCGLNQ